jgi:hypothetical protein
MSLPDASATAKHDAGKKEEQIEHLEQVPTQTPPSEMEKGQHTLTQTTTGPVVHEKVRIMPSVLY